MAREMVQMQTGFGNYVRVPSKRQEPHGAALSRSTGSPAVGLPGRPNGESKSHKEFECYLAVTPPGELDNLLKVGWQANFAPVQWRPGTAYALT